VNLPVLKELYKKPEIFEAMVGLDKNIAKKQGQGGSGDFFKVCK
jgi:hypothetical protein